MPAESSRGPALPSPVDPQANAGLLFVGADTGIDIFPSHGQNQQRTGQITQGLQNSNIWGLAVDRKGGLWAALPIARAVTHFPKGASTPDRTLTLNTIPRGVAVSADGTLFVAAQPGVLVFGPHDTAPKQTLKIAETDVVPIYVTLDKSGDIYVSYTWGTSSYGEFGGVYEFLNGKKKGQPTPISINPYLADVKVDPSGNLLVVDQGSPAAVDVYDVNTWSLLSQFDTNTDNPVALAFDKTGKYLYVDQGSLSQMYTVSVFDYATETLVNTIYSPELSGCCSVGLAVSPAYGL